MSSPDVVKIMERTFEARNCPDPKKKEKLNADPLTSEWQPNKRFIVRFKSGASVLFRTKEAAQVYVDGSAYDAMKSGQGVKL